MKRGRTTGEGDPSMIGRSGSDGQSIVAGELLDSFGEELRKLGRDPHQLDERGEAVLTGDIRCVQVAGDVVGLATTIATTKESGIAGTATLIKTADMQASQSLQDRMVQANALCELLTPNISELELLALSVGAGINASLGININAGPITNTTILASNSSEQRCSQRGK